MADLTPSVSEGLSPRQVRVEAMIKSVGGYWRPLAGVARLLEELGELSEALDSRPIHKEALAGELADLLIISTCTANQFKAKLPDELPSPQANRSKEDLLRSLVAAAGQIARLVNYYDGPKLPRSTQGWTSLSTVISGFHEDLSSLAARFEVDLDDSVERVLQATPRRDAGRFKRSYDPTTALSLSQFETVRAATACPFALAAKLWGSPPWQSTESLRRNAQLLVPVLRRFVRAAPLEDLDGIVIHPGWPFKAGSMGQLAHSFYSLLRAISAEDRTPYESFAAPVDTPGWQFSFDGLRMFVSVFSSVYALGHVRHAPEGTFILFQPEGSFERHGIGRKADPYGHRKRDVRERFMIRNIAYPSQLIDQRIECVLYLLPRYDGDLEARWWQPVNSAQLSLFDDPSR